MTGQPAQTQLAGEAQHPGSVQAVSAVEAAGGVVANDVAAPGPVQSRPDVLARAEDVAHYERVAVRLLAAGDTEHFVLAVTSSVSGEGVSTVCVGAAVALATNTTKSVLLVDANLRRPALHEMLGVPIGPGLHELLAAAEGAAALSPGVGVRAVRTSVPNLWFLPSGLGMAQPTQLMTSSATKARLQDLRERFDYTIVDCPPLLTAVDASSICRSADGAIIVLRSGLTPREDVARATELLEGTPIMGVILNGV